jgi:hypothetical protein
MNNAVAHVPGGWVVGSFEIRKLIDADLSAIHDLFFPEQFELFLFKHTIREA